MIAYTSLTQMEEELRPDQNTHGQRWIAKEMGHGVCSPVGRQTPLADDMDERDDSEKDEGRDGI
jgi:hypothetical protein